MKKDVEKWVKRLKELSDEGVFDLSRDEDLSVALMNLISLEEHLFFSAVKTGDGKYLEMLDSVRGLRKELLVMIVKNPAGEEWCVSKHLLAASMRLVEVGTKELNSKGVNSSWSFFKSAFDLYSLFWAVNLKMVSSEKVVEKNSGNFFNKFSSVVKKVLDCCKE